jgi:predicted DnaQ family exonuclease/DinG family helicase
MTAKKNKRSAKTKAREAMESLAFVAWDLETTGLSHSQDSVIEIGAVSVNAEGKRETFRTFVNTDKKIPLPVKKLTGISEADLEGAPELEEAVRQFSDFAGDCPMVLHNAAFDLGFLENHWLPQAEVWDSLDLARAVFPGLRSHSLEYLARLFGFHPGRSHRALDDATATAELFLLLCAVLQGQSQDLLSAMQAVAPPQYRLLLSHLAERGRQARHFHDLAHVDEAVLAEAVKVGKQPDVRPAGLKSVDSMAEVFGPGGTLSRVMGGGFEQRREQEEIAKAVSRALDDDLFLAVEAGTGVGKSLAYLAPAASWARRNRERVVIATYTRNLQEQLYYKDIPLAAAAIGPFRAALLKGRNNYLCWRKWREAAQYPDLMLGGRERDEAMILALWAEATQSGDISEHGGFNPGRASSLWAKLSADSATCQGGHCPFQRRCFLYRARKAAQEAELVVINHSLLFTDLASQNRILPEYRRLVCDEAHNLEQVATDYLGFSLNRWEAHNFLQSVYTRQGGESGLLAKLSVWLKEHRQAATAAWQGSLLELGESVLECAKLADRLFHSKWNQKSGTREKVRYRPGDRLQLELQEAAEGLTEALLLLADRLRLLHELVSLASGLDRVEQEAFADQLYAAGQQAEGISDQLSRLTGAEDREYVYWAEFRETGLILAAGPLQVGKVIAQKLHPSLKTMVYTSATLSVDGKFDYFMERSGLALADRDRTEHLLLKSPFDYASQAGLAIVNFLPSPKDKDFNEQVSRLIEDMLHKIRTGTLVLFTSFDLLHRCYWKLVKAGIPVLAQGLDGSPAQILETARRSKNTIVLGTNSFWEGVDLPGQALELLVITKLPFSVPTEPLVEARCQAIEQEGGSAFHRYLLPEAVIRLRQGFGRLIRNKTDRGLAVLCDPRAVGSDYGQVFLRSLPVMPTDICQNPEQLWQALSFLDEGAYNG